MYVAIAWLWPPWRPLLSACISLHKLHSLAGAHHRRSALQWV